MTLLKMNSIVHIVHCANFLPCPTRGHIIWCALISSSPLSLTLPRTLLSVSFPLCLQSWHLQFSLEYYSCLDLCMAVSSFRAPVKVKCHCPPFVIIYDLCKTFYLFTQTFIEFYYYELGPLLGTKDTQMNKTKLFSSRASVE